jgi:hypothetical protein
MMLFRIFCRALPKVGLFIRAFAAVLVVYYVALLFVRIFNCRPPSAAWKGGVRCLNFYPVLVVDSIMSLITDGVIFTLAIFLTSNLHLPLKRKIRVAAVLGAGGLTILLSIYRLCLLFLTGENPDWTFNAMDWFLFGHAKPFP